MKKYSACLEPAKALWLVAIFFLTPFAGFADPEEKERSNDDRYLIRFEWANDIFTGTDDGPTVSWGCKAAPISKATCRATRSSLSADLTVSRGWPRISFADQPLPLPRSLIATG